MSRLHNHFIVSHSREFRVVGSCQEEKYVNEESNKTYVDSDVCDPLIFRFGKQRIFKKKD